MIIWITLKEALEKCDWGKFCGMFGWDEHCIAEGIDPKTVQDMTEVQAKELGLI